MALVPVPGTGLGILRHDKRGSSSFAALPPEVRARAKDPQRLILTKANSRSTVHRRSYLDYIAIKRVNETGELVGEYRFLGLYTHEAYHESIARIPVLRRKLAEVLERSGATPDSHDGKDLTEILEAYPREELFQISADELTPIALGVLHLRSHPRTRLFLRKDVYGRFMSCVVYLPRDRYTTRGPAAHPGDPARGAARGDRRVQRHGGGVAAGPAAGGGAGQAGHLAGRRGHRRPGGQDRRRGAVVGRGSRRRGRAQAG